MNLKVGCSATGKRYRAKPYDRLFDAIGTTYGAGDGSTTFRLPDCRGRVTAGKDNMGGTSANRMSVHPEWRQPWEPWEAPSGIPLPWPRCHLIRILTMTSLSQHNSQESGLAGGGNCGICSAGIHHRSNRWQRGDTATLQPTIIFNKIIRYL